MSKFFITTALVLISISFYAQNANINWITDLDYLQSEFPQKHCNFGKLNNQSFNSDIENIKRNVKNLNDFEIAIQLQQAIARLGDSHSGSNITPFINKQQILPLGLQWFNDGLYILHTTNEYKSILGLKLTAINNFPLQTITDSLSTLIAVENEAMVKTSIPKFIPMLQLLQYFKFANTNEVTLQLCNSDGITSEHSIKVASINRENRASYHIKNIPLCYQNERDWFHGYYQEKDHIYYIKYSNCWSKELQIKYKDGRNADRLPSFVAFEEQTLKDINSLSIDKIIFDVRFNSGGNSTQGTAFIVKLAKYLKTHPDVKIYGVIGRKTFSSAILNAMDLKKICHAPLVGVETSGSPNHFGEVRSFKLPQSGLNVNYSTKYFQRIDGDVHTIVPDHFEEATFAQFKQGIDPVYNWIAEQ